MRPVDFPRRLSRPDHSARRPRTPGVRMGGESSRLPGGHRRTVLPGDADRQRNQGPAFGISIPGSAQLRAVVVSSDPELSATFDFGCSSEPALLAAGSRGQSKRSFALSRGSPHFPTAAIGLISLIAIAMIRATRFSLLPLSPLNRRSDWQSRPNRSWGQSRRSPGNFARLVTEDGHTTLARLALALPSTAVRVVFCQLLVVVEKQAFDDANRPVEEPGRHPGRPC